MRIPMSEVPSIWLARDIMVSLGYSKWQNFEIAIKRAMASAETSGIPDQKHFADVGKMTKFGKRSRRQEAIEQRAAELLADLELQIAPEVAAGFRY